MSPNFGLELVEAALSNHNDSMATHPEQVHVIRAKLMPFLLKSISEKTYFATTVRCMRLIRLLVFSLLPSLVVECEVILGLLNHLLSPEAGPSWKRALALEVFAAIFASGPLTRQIYELYDHQEEKRSIVRDYLASMVRLAGEHPELIGSHHGSSMELQQSFPPSEQTSEDDGIMKTIGAVMAKSGFSTSGISRELSMPRAPCIDHLEKTDPPTLPPSYIYAMALTSINMFSEGVASFLLPLTVRTSGKARRKTRTSAVGDDPQYDNKLALDQASADTNIENDSNQSDRVARSQINPMSLTSIPEYKQVQICAEMVEACWPALLATTSTFFNANLDVEFYHALVRSFQKFTQIAGLLELDTVRAAFLTALANRAAPQLALKRCDIPGSEKAQSSRLPHQGSLDSESEAEDDPEAPRASIDNATSSLTWHNMLCLRALINLGIALGPSLDGGWSIIISAIQRVDHVLHPSGREKQQRGSLRSSVVREDGRTNDFDAAVMAANAAVDRLMISSGALPNTAYLELLAAFTSLLRPQNRPERRNEYLRNAASIIDLVDQSVSANIWRLVEKAQAISGWDEIISCLLDLISDKRLSSNMHERATRVFSALVERMISSEEFKSLSLDDKQGILSRCLESLVAATSAIYHNRQQIPRQDGPSAFKMHHAIFEAVHSLIEHNGEDFGPCWSLALSVIETVSSGAIANPDKSAPAAHVKSSTVPQLIRSSFSSLELICSDYLEMVHPQSTQKFIDLIQIFTVQEVDINISLTSITFYRRIADFLQHQDGANHLPKSLQGHGVRDLETMLIEHNIQFSAPALWLYLEVRLASSVVDKRAEIRRSALQTVLRILSASSSPSDPTDWEICYEYILTRLLSSTLYGDAEPIRESEEKDQFRALVIGGISDLIAQHLGLVRTAKASLAISPSFLQWLKKAFQSLDLQRSVYAGLANILEKVPAIEYMDRNVLESLWIFWKSTNPASGAVDGNPANSVAIQEYLEMYCHIARLSSNEDHINAVKSTIQHLKTCVAAETFATPSVGRERITQIQAGVIKCIKHIPISHTKTLEPVLGFLADAVQLVYRQEGKHGERSASYLAFSITAISLLEDLVLHQGEHGLEFEMHAINLSIQALTTPLQSKYVWPENEKKPYGWMTATSSALNILEDKKALLASQLSSTKPLPEIWSSLIDLLRGILHVNNPRDCPWATDISADTEFDTTHFHRLHNLLSPFLGSPSCPAHLLKSYINNLFTNSLIHEPNRFDLPPPSSPDTHPLINLESEHIGRVKPLPPSLRSKLCYVLLETLFDLVTIKERTPEQILIARAAAPYFTLRVGVTLKAYVKDKPLRGWKMPYPLSQRREMYRILGTLVELDSEPEAFAEGSVAENKEGKKKMKEHLKPLFKLLRQTMNVARQADERMYEAVDRVMGVYEREVLEM